MSEQLFANTIAREVRHFQEIELGSIASLTTGCRYLQHEWPSDELQPCTIIEKITGNTFILEPTNIRISDREKRKFLLRDGDILFKNRTGPAEFGKSAIFNIYEEVLHTKYLRIRLEKGFDSTFLNQALHILRSQGKLHRLASHNKNLSSINIEDLKRLKIAFTAKY